MKSLSAWLIGVCLSLSVVGWAAESKPPVTANQTMHDMQGSKAAQSQTGDAIVADKVDKSTHIAHYQLPPELVAELAKSKQGMSEFERRLWWLGVGVITLLGSISLIAYFQFLFSDSAEQINSEFNSRQHFIHSLQTGIRRDVYRRGVSSLLSFLQRTYGGKMSWQAFNLSLVLAYVYPFLMFLLAYSYFGGTGDFSGEPLFPADSPWRAAVFPIIIAYCFFVLLIFKWYRKIDNWVKRYLEGLNVKPMLVDKIWRIVTGVVTAILLTISLEVYKRWIDNIIWLLLVSMIYGYIGKTVSMAVATIVAALVLATGVNNGVTPVILLLASIVVFNFFLKGTTVFAGILSSSFIIIAFLNKLFAKSLLITFFFLALPLLNALLDYLSWAVSRFFLEQTLKAPNIIIIALEILADSVLAVLFLLLFCVFLPAIGLGLDALYSHWQDSDGLIAQTNWRDYVVVAALYPWGKGLMITSMLFSTLLPTFLHLLLGSSAVVIHALQGEKLAAFLQTHPPDSKIHNLIASLWLYAYVLLALGLLIGLFWLAATIWHLPVAQWLYQFTYWIYGAYGLPTPPELFG